MKHAKVMMMKIGKCKKELARIISEHGGWRDGYGFSAQDGDDCAVWFYDNAPVRGSGAWWVTSGSGLGHCGIEDVAKLPNWHQTILSSSEYFHLYPAPDADGWIEWNGGECPVERESLVDYKLLSGSVCVIGEAAGGLIWQHGEAGTASIIAYRLHKPEQVETVEYNYSGVVYTGPVQSEFVVTEKPTLDQLLQDWRNADDYAKRKQAEADEAAAMRDERWNAVQERAGELSVTVWLCEPDDGWIEWGGGECPVGEEQLVRIKVRGETGSARGKAGHWSWGHSGCGSDIVAYRLARP